MRLRILLAALLALSAYACTSNPEAQIEQSLKQIQAALPKDLGGGITYTQAAYEKDTKTIVFGYTTEAEGPFPEEMVAMLKNATLASLRSDPSVAGDPIWRLAAKAGATFRYEYCLPDGSPAGSFTLSQKEYAY